MRKKKDVQTKPGRKRLRFRESGRGRKSLNTNTQTRPAHNILNEKGCSVEKSLEKQRQASSLDLGFNPRMQK